MCASFLTGNFFVYIIIIIKNEFEGGVTGQVYVGAGWRE